MGFSRSTHYLMCLSDVSEYNKQHNDDSIEFVSMPSIQDYYEVFLKQKAGVAKSQMFYEYIVSPIRNLLAGNIVKLSNGTEAISGIQDKSSIQDKKGLKSLKKKLKQLELDKKS